MHQYVYTKRAKVDGVGEAGGVADIGGKYPLDYLLLHGYVQLDAQVMSGALGSPESNGRVESPTLGKPSRNNRK
jgi:hypothetical protein